jgi:DNA mismatch endonuclease (patch repair protein)
MIEEASILADNLTKAQRSKLMSRIRDRDTIPELEVRHQLSAAGIRGYRLRPRLPGKPDIVFTHSKVAIFIDGCFWHGCPKCYTRPATRRRFWDNKLKQNTLRDRSVDHTLTEMGWKVMHFWEHEVMRNPGKVVGDVISLLATTA